MKVSLNSPSTCNYCGHDIATLKALGNSYQSRSVSRLINEFMRKYTLACKWQCVVHEDVIKDILQYREMIFLISVGQSSDQCSKSCQIKIGDLELLPGSNGRAIFF